MEPSSSSFAAACNPANFSFSTNFVVLYHPSANSEQSQPDLLGGPGIDLEKIFSFFCGGAIGIEIGIGVIRQGCPSSPRYGSVKLADVEKLNDELNPSLAASLLLIGALKLFN